MGTKKLPDFSPKKKLDKKSVQYVPYAICLNWVLSHVHQTKRLLQLNDLTLVIHQVDWMQYNPLPRQLSYRH